MLRRPYLRPPFPLEPLSPVPHQVQPQGPLPVPPGVKKSRRCRRRSPGCDILLSLPRNKRIRIQRTKIKERGIVTAEKTGAEDLKLL
jgi:hypothetical protein